MFVSDVATTPPIAAPHPDPHRAMPEHIGQVLGLLHTLITYGRNLADTLRRHAADPYALPCFAFVTAVFGTADLALILARITRGLRIAAALEVTLVNRPARMEQVQASARPPSARQPRAPRPAARDRDDPAALLDALPTPEDIAAQLRHRPVGAVLVDICSDLGITTSHPLWRELTETLIENHGSLVALFKDVWKRVRISNFVAPDTPMISPMPSGWRPAPLVSSATGGTGPP